LKERDIGIIQNGIPGFEGIGFFGILLGCGTADLNGNLSEVIVLRINHIIPYAIAIVNYSEVDDDTRIILDGLAMGVHDDDGKVGISEYLRRRKVRKGGQDYLTKKI